MQVGKREGNQTDGTKAYPELTREMVQAALEYAAAIIDEEQVIARA